MVATDAFAAAPSTATAAKACSTYRVSMENLLWHHKCGVKVRNKGKWTYPHHQRTRSGRSIWTISNDGCSGLKGLTNKVGDKFSFRPACDMHDYGYAVIRTGKISWTPDDARLATDKTFKKTMYEICKTYKGPKGSFCRRTADAFYKAVRKVGKA